MHYLQKTLDKIQRERKLNAPKRPPRKRRLENYADDLMRLKAEGATGKEMLHFLEEEKNVSVCIYTVYRFLNG